MVGSLDRICRSLLTASCDTVYIFVVNILMVTVVGFVPLYLTIHVWDLSPKYFWGTISFWIFTRNIPLFFRIHRNLWKDQAMEPLQKISSFS